MSHGTLQQYLKFVEYMNSPHEDAFGARLDGYSISDQAQTAKFCKLWEDRGKRWNLELINILVWQ